MAKRLNNKILKYANEAKDNIESDVEYSASKERISGVVTGIANGNNFNKALKQSSTIASGTAEYLARSVDQATKDINDTMSEEDLADVMEEAIKKTARETLVASDSTLTPKDVLTVEDNKVKLTPVGTEQGNIPIMDDQKRLDITVDTTQLAGTITNDQLDGGITNDKLAGGITEDKLQGDIPVDKITGLGALATKDIINLESEVEGVLPIANGGTGASTVGDAQSNLDIVTKTGDQAISGSKTFKGKLYVEPNVDGINAPRDLNLITQGVAFKDQLNGKDDAPNASISFQKSTSPDDMNDMFKVASPNADFSILSKQIKLDINNNEDNPSTLGILADRAYLKTQTPIEITGTEVTINNVVEPTTDGMASNKTYVDRKATEANAYTDTEIAKMVSLTGDQTISGSKTFKAKVKIKPSPLKTGGFIPKEGEPDLKLSVQGCNYKDLVNNHDDDVTETYTVFENHEHASKLSTATPGIITFNAGKGMSFDNSKKQSIESESSLTIGSPAGDSEDQEVINQSGITAESKFKIDIKTKQFDNEKEYGVRITNVLDPKGTNDAVSNAFLTKTIAKTKLEDLGNVDDTEATEGQFLKYDGTKWLSATANVDTGKVFVISTQEQFNAWVDASADSYDRYLSVVIYRKETPYTLNKKLNLTNKTKYIQGIGRPVINVSGSYDTFAIGYDSPTKYSVLRDLDINFDQTVNRTGTSVLGFIRNFNVIKDNVIVGDYRISESGSANVYLIMTDDTSDFTTLIESNDIKNTSVNSSSINYTIYVSNYGTITGNTVTNSSSSSSNYTIFVSSYGTITGNTVTNSSSSSSINYTICVNNYGTITGNTVTNSSSSSSSSNYTIFVSSYGTVGNNYIYVKGATGNVYAICLSTTNHKIASGNTVYIENVAVKNSICFANTNSSASDAHSTWIGNSFYFYSCTFPSGSQSLVKGGKNCIMNVARGAGSSITFSGMYADSGTSNPCNSTYSGGWNVSLS